MTMRIGSLSQPPVPEDGAARSRASRHVLCLATGGTIASRGGPGGRTASVSADELVRSVSGRHPGIEVSALDLATRGSFSAGLDDLLQLTAGIVAAFKDDIDGLVVTHGTDSMEESAFLAGLVVDDPRPLVFTGAQRPFDDPGRDGPANLADAIAVAASPQARGRGSLICFDGSVFAARGATKVHTLSAHAFDAPGRGPVAQVADGRVHPLAPAHRPPALPLDPAGPLPRVDIVNVYPGADAALLRACVEAGARGVVVNAFGVGNAPPSFTPEIERLSASGIPVLICSRVGSGPVLPLYGGGGGADLERAGAVFGDDLSAWQGRLLLAAALACWPHTAAQGLRNWLDARA